jgi:hypothetical protein
MEPIISIATEESAMNDKAGLRRALPGPAPDPEASPSVVRSLHIMLVAHACLQPRAENGARHVARK